MNVAQAKLDAARQAEAKALEAKRKADAKVEQLSKDDGGLSDLAAKLEAAKKAAADAATAQQKAEQAQKDADKAVSDSSSNAEAKQQAAADAKSEADAKKEAADEAQDKLSQGAVAYFGDKGASQAVKVLTDPTVTEYLDAIHNGAKGDATTLDNMIEALKFIQEANQLRAKEGLQPLKVSDTLMAQAMADADYANNNVNHPLQFPASENLAWGYTDPFNGWYDTEKSMYEKDMSDGVLDCKASDGKPVNPCAYGHYTTLVNTDFTLTGFGVSQNGNITGIGGNTHSQLFTENANGIGSDAGRIMDVDAYLADLTAYRDSLTGADAAYQTALSKSEQAAQDASDAAKALAAAQQAARKAAEEAQQAAQKARDLQAGADEAQKAYDEAVKANEDKAKALEEARKDQAGEERGVLRRPAGHQGSPVRSRRRHRRPDRSPDGSGQGEHGSHRRTGEDRYRRQADPGRRQEQDGCGSRDQAGEHGQDEGRSRPGRRQDREGRGREGQAGRARRQDRFRREG